MLGRLLGRLQIWLPCIHRYAKVWICAGPPEVTRVESHSIEPLRIFPQAKGVGVRENVAAMQALNHSEVTTYIARQPSVRHRMNILRPNPVADTKTRWIARWAFGRSAAMEQRFYVAVP